MLVKVGDHPVNPKHVARITTGYKGVVLVITMDEYLPCCSDVSGDGVTKDLVMRYLNECEMNGCKPGLCRTWEQFMKQEGGDA